MRKIRILRVERLSKDATLPKYAHPGDAGMDLFAIENASIPPGGRVLIRTGIRIQLPAGTEAQIRPRSGLAMKEGVTVLNSPGTIDEGYRGEIAVLLINLGAKAFQVRPKMRIAQMVIQQFTRVLVSEKKSLPDSTRSTAGFGSTGI